MEHGCQQVYKELRELHDVVLDSIITGKVPFPSIAVYGVNNEFEMLVIHSTTTFTYDKQKYFKRWLKQGLIYPRVYATCFEWHAQENGKPFPYGIFNNLKPEDLEPGYEKRRADIGMGVDRLDGMRFHIGGWSNRIS